MVKKMGDRMNYWKRLKRVRELYGGDIIRVGNVCDKGRIFKGCDR